MNLRHAALRAKPGIFVGRERVFVFCLVTCAVCAVAGERLWALLASPLVLGLVLLWMCGAVLCAALAVVRHAERVAEVLGEPVGTLVLTLSVTVIEVTSVAAVMLHGENNPTLARDTLFAVVMIILNGMVGLSLLIGAWRHREQVHNLQGANAYLGVIIPLVVLTLVLPDFTQTTAGPTLSFDQQVFLVLVAAGMYAIFLLMQTGRHRHYFAGPSGVAQPAPRAAKRSEAIAPTLWLVAYLVPALYLAGELAHPIDYVIETKHAPTALGGVILAVIVATPEAIGAVRAAVANQLQRSINIVLGSMLSTIGLTVPLMIVISEFTGRNLVLGVQHTDLVMLVLTLAVSIVTFSSGRTHIIQGMVHIILFAAYLLLIFQD